MSAFRIASVFSDRMVLQRNKNINVFGTGADDHTAYMIGLIIAAVVILVYTLLGGFKAVCYTDFIQGLLMLVAILAVPIIAYIGISGDLNGALDLIRTYWGGMLDAGATTFWEDFETDWLNGSFGIDSMPAAGKKDIHADFGKYCYKGLRHSLCHGWAGGPAAFLSEKVLGITPVEPGFRKVQIKPQLWGLDCISGAVPTPYGLITVEADKKGQKIGLPDGITMV